MPERLKRLNRLRESWAQRKKSTEYRIAAIATEISRVEAEEEHLARGLDGEMGHLSLFPDLLTRRLLAIDDEKKKLAAKNGVGKSDPPPGRIEPAALRDLSGQAQGSSAAEGRGRPLESTIEVFLQRRP